MILFLFFRRINTIKEIEFSTEINVYNREQDGVMIFHDNKLLKYKRFFINLLFYSYYKKPGGVMLRPSCIRKYEGSIPHHVKYF